MSARRRFRLATSRVRIVPSFAVIGAQRAGTTSLFDDLLRHPDVVAPAGGAPDLVWAQKELDFFSNKFYEGLGWYRAFFPTVAAKLAANARGRDLIAGEATPYYLFHPGAPMRMAATLPHMRLIVLLRDPVARAYSHYQLMRRIGAEQLSFEEALVVEQERLTGRAERLEADPRYRDWVFRRLSYFTRGLYAEQLERWFRYFPRDQFLILGSEEYFARPFEVQREALAFVGARADATTGDPAVARPASRNRGSYEPLDPAIRALLEERYAEPNARLVRLLGREFEWTRSRRRDAEGDGAAQPSPAVQEPGAAS